MVKSQTEKVINPPAIPVKTKHIPIIATTPIFPIDCASGGAVPTRNKMMPNTINIVDTAHAHRSMLLIHWCDNRNYQQARQVIAIKFQHITRSGKTVRRNNGIAV